MKVIDLSEAIPFVNLIKFIVFKLDSFDVNKLLRVLRSMT